MTKHDRDTVSDRIVLDTLIDIANETGKATLRPVYVTDDGWLAYDYKEA